MIGTEQNERDFENLSKEQINQICQSICMKIYVARNYSLNENTILEQLARIDRLFRDRENYN